MRPSIRHLAQPSALQALNVARERPLTTALVEGLELGPLLARGSFGSVFRGRYRGKKVAVKVSLNTLVPFPSQGYRCIDVAGVPWVLCVWCAKQFRTIASWVQVCTGNMRSTQGKALKPWKNMEALQVCAHVYLSAAAVCTWPCADRCARE
jgi:hypothetical protein